MCDELEVELDDIDSTAFSSGKGSKSYPTTHLQSAMKCDLIKYAYGIPVGNPGRFKHTDQEIKRMFALYPLLTEQDYCTSLDYTKILYSWLRSVDDWSRVCPDYTLWKCQSSSVLHNINVQLDALRYTHPYIGDHYSRLPWETNVRVKNFKVARELWDKAITKSGRQRMEFTRNREERESLILPSKVNLPGDLEIGHSANLCVLRRKTDISIGTRDLLLMIGDLISERYLIFLSTEIAAEIGEEQYPTSDAVKQIFDWGDSVMVEDGLAGFQLLKEFEPLVTSEMLLRTNDEFSDGAEFRKSLLNELGKKNSVFKQQAEALITILAHIPTMHHLAQIFGLYRLWGHPYVDSADGLLKIKHLGLSKKVIPNALKRELACSFKSHFCKQYRAKVGKWPNLDTSRLPADSYLRAAIESNRVLDQSNLAYKPSEWFQVKGLKTFEIDSSYNLATMLSDKALSLDRDELKYHCDRFRNIGIARERRVITNWLRSTQISARELIETVSEKGLEKKELIIGVTPKEREMKTCPRMFSLMSLRMRMFVVAVGELLADHIVPYFPEITVGDSSIQLTRRLYDMTRSQRSTTPSQSVDVIMNIDFSKWNTNIRAELTNESFKFLDELFGLKQCVNYIPKMFTESLIYLADGSYLPDFDANLDVKKHPLAWTGHLGGLEGLNQKGWTAVTVVLIEMVARKHNIRFRLIGQGDNQVLRLTIPLVGDKFDPSGISAAKQTLKLFKASFVDEMEQAGLPVKISETWCSSKLFAYGKQHFFEGEPLAMSLKRLSRVFWLSNDLFPSLENAISTIHSNSLSACQSDLTTIVPFVVAVTETIYTILYHANESPYTGVGADSLIHSKRGIWKVTVENEDNGEQVTLTKSLFSLKMATYSNYIRHPVLTNNWQLVSSIALVPRVLGGYPIQYLSSFLMRGFPDPVSESLSMLRRIIDLTDERQVKVALTSIANPEYSIYCSSQMIIQDPFSINALIPSSATGVLKSAVRTYLNSPGIVTNPFFLRFFQESESSVKPLCQALTRSTPLWPRLLHDVFDASLPGFAASVVGRIVKTTTVVMEAIKVDGKRVEERMVYSDQNLFISIIYKLNEHRPGGWTCSLEHAIDLRNNSWHRFAPIEGVSTPHPIEYLKSVQLDYGECRLCDLNQQPDYLLVYVSPGKSDNPCSRMWNKLGPTTPYLGSSTSEKMRQELYTSFEITDPLITRAARVLRAINWLVSESDELAQLMTRIFSCITDVAPECFFSVEDSFSGSAEHRYQDYASFHGGLISTLYGLPSYVHMSTNQWNSYSKGATNHNIHFQAVLCIMQALVMFSKKTVGRYDSHVFHFHAVHKECIKVIQEPSITGLPGVNNVILQSYPDSEYCFISKDRLIERRRDCFKSVKCKKLETLPVNHQDKALCAIMAQELTDLVLVALRETRITHIGVQRTAPMTWGKDADPVILIEETSLYIACSIYRRNRHEINLKHVQSVQDLLSALIPLIGSLPDKAFYPLNFLFQFPESRLSLLASMYAIEGPHSFPMKDSSVAACCKRAVISVLSSRSLYMRPMILTFNKFIVRQNEWLSNQIFSLLCRSDKLSTLWESWEVLDKLICEATLSNESDFEVAIQSILTIDLPLQKDLSQSDRSTIINDWDEILRTLTFTEVNMSGDKAHKLRPRAQVMDTKPSLSFIQTSSVYDSRLSIICPPVTWNLSASSVTPLVDMESPPRRSDFRSHFFRPVPLITTAHYKYLDLISEYVQTYNPGDMVIICGDGTGGVTTLIHRLNPNIRLYFNSLVDLEDTVAHSLTSFYPPATDYILHTKSIYKMRQSIEGISDITDPRFVNQLQSVSKGKNVRMIVCDAEGAGWTSPEKGITIVGNLTKAAQRIGHDVVLVIKSYATDFRCVSVQSSILSSVFEVVKAARSAFSSYHNTEIFFIAERPTNAQQYIPILRDNSIKGIMPSLPYQEQMKDVIKQLLNYMPPTPTLCDRVTTLLNSTSLSKQIMAQLEQAYRFVPLNSIFDYPPLNWMQLYWGPITSRLRSRLSAIKTRTSELSVMAGYTTARDVVLHIFSLLLRIYDSEYLLHTVFKSTFADGYVMFYATENRRTSAIIVSSAFVEECSNLTVETPFSRRGSQAYFVKISKAFSKPQTKRLFSRLGQFRNFFCLNATARLTGLRWVLSSEDDTGYSSGPGVLAIDMTDMVVRIPRFAWPISQMLKDKIDEECIMYKVTQCDDSYYHAMTRDS